jgi:hypothetical protein
MRLTRRTSDNKVVRRKIGVRHALYVRDNRDRVRHVTIIDIDGLIPGIVGSNALDFYSEVSCSRVHTSIRVSDTAE